MKPKLNLNNTVTNIFLLVALIYILISIIDAISYAFSEKLFLEFVEKIGEETELTERQLRADYRLLILTKTLLGSFIYMFFVGYVALARTKVKIGYGFIVFWTTVFLGSILGAFMLNATSIWFMVVSSIASIVGIATMFYLFAQLSQLRHYGRLKNRWGDK